MSQDPRIGAVLQDRYRIVARVAEGAMGVIYRGERLGLERAVAIKFLHESVTANADSRRRFETEAKAASRLGHPNCVAVIDFGIDRDAPYLIMDYVAGRTLRDLLNERPVTVARALDLGRQILAGLAHAHGHGIIHRDIKPENVLVTADGLTEHARLLDFGLAKLKDAATITDGVAVGTPSYMSPEQTLGERADARSDVYGAGVVLYELLTGVTPFKSTSPFEVMRMHREVPVPSFASAAPDRAIAADLEAVVHKALAKDPAARFPTAVELASALERTLRPRKRSGGLRWPAFVAGIAVALGVAGVVWAVRSEPDKPVTAVVAVLPLPPVVPDPPIEMTASPPEEIPGVAEALALAETGLQVQAEGALEHLRLKHPTSAYVSYAIGILSAKRQRWSAAVDAYADAIRKRAAYRTDPQLQRDIVAALGSDKAYIDASALIVNTLGATAIAALEVAEHSADPQLRLRAARVRSRLRP